MIKVNQNYQKLKASYLFSDIRKRVESYQAQYPDKKIIRLGIGDVTLPLCPSIVSAFKNAVDEMSVAATFRGYGPENGYEFLREKIAESDFKARGAMVSADEIFVSDGSKCDTGNFQELFSNDVVIAVQDPVYPVYVDTNVMAGRTGDAEDGRYKGLVYLECSPENNYTPALPSRQVDLIYLCYPNNPVGSVVSRDVLKKWVDYARANNALILFDAAYEAFIRDSSIPHSIFEIEGAREVAIEFRSFSKTAGFTGVRCAYTVVPKECCAYADGDQKVSLYDLWNRRHSTKFNGVSYPVQRAAEAVYSKQGRKEVVAQTDYYLANAALIRRELSNLGFSCVGGEHSPYVWVNCKQGSWEFFDMLLNNAGVVCTPGAGFGKCGEGHVRFSAFNSKENIEIALQRIASSLG